MKKGKLFGKLNIVDIVVIVVLIAAVALVGVKYLRSGSGNGDDGRSITYKVVVPVVPTEVYEAMKDKLPGQMMSNGIMQNATVDSVEALPCDIDKIEYNGTASTVSYELAVTDEYVKLVFTCTAYPTDSVTNTLGSQEIRIGKDHIVKTAEFELSGYITSVTENG